jgi:hypothetical protein
MVGTTMGMATPRSNYTRPCGLPRVAASRSPPVSQLCKQFRRDLNEGDDNDNPRVQGEPPATTDPPELEHLISVMLAFSSNEVEPLDDQQRLQHQVAPPGPQLDAVAGPC